MITLQLHPAMQELTGNGKKRKFITYDELNTSLPDELVDPSKIDELLVYLAGFHVDLVESSRAPSPHIVQEQELVAAKQVHKSHQSTGSGDATDTDEEEMSEETEASLKADLAEALQEATNRRIADPVRMYLTQMGEIRLLTRPEEIRLAKKIETCRMIFRRKVLENDYSISSCVEILEMVHNGELPFDRTMKISTAEDNAKNKIAARIPYNLKTVRRLLDLNRIDWELLEDSSRLSHSKIAELKATIHSRRRKMATLIEELSLRTSRVQPLLRKLAKISERMRRLEVDLERSDRKPDMFDPEDVMVMRDELSGMRSLLLDSPDHLEESVQDIKTVFDEYEHAKRDLAGCNLRLVVSIA